MRRCLLMSFVCVHDGESLFRAAARERLASEAQALSPRAELIFIDLVSGKNDFEHLLEDYPAVRVLVPAQKIGYHDAVFLGLREALASHACVLSDACIPIHCNLEEILESFRLHPQLAVLGPAFMDAEGKELPCTQMVYSDGRLDPQECITTFPHAAAFLPRYLGIYACDKVLRFVPPPARRLREDWACLEWFYGVWARGWQVRLDPSFCMMTESAPEVFSCRSFMERARLYRHEIFFLRRHGLVRESAFRFFGHGVRRSGLAFLWAWLTPKLFVRLPGGEAQSGSEVFARIQANEEAGDPALAALLHGSAEEPAGGTVYTPDGAMPEANYMEDGADTLIAQTAEEKCAPKIPKPRKSRNTKPARNPQSDTAVIVQARSGSTRLAGKAFLELGGRALTHTVLEALRAAREAEVFMLAVPERDQEAFAPIAAEHGFRVFGGSEEDVLARYAGAARACGCGTIVRATGDNPFVCPHLLDDIARYHREHKADLAHYLGIPLGAGVEVISADALFAAAAEASAPFEREHVTPWIYSQRARFRVEEPDLARDPGIRLTVDTMADLERARRILAACGNLRPIPLERILALFRTDPEIFS
ncbi:MAG: hypothetical protein LBC99_05645 [Spirochaetota bacterium]|nr:hypothetical protein [Spirochaetota bacterium]